MKIERSMLRGKVKGKTDSIRADLEASQEELITELSHLCLKSFNAY